MAGAEPKQTGAWRCGHGFELEKEIVAAGFLEIGCGNGQASGWNKLACAEGK